MNNRVTIFLAIAVMFLGVWNVKQRLDRPKKDRELVSISYSLGHAIGFREGVQYSRDAHPTVELNPERF